MSALVGVFLLAMWINEILSFYYNIYVWKKKESGGGLIIVFVVEIIIVVVFLISGLWF